MPTVLFVLIVVLVVITLLGHALWLFATAILRALGILPPRRPAERSQEAPRRPNEQTDLSGFRRVVERLWRLGHLSDAERQRLIQLGTGTTAASAGTAGAGPVMSSRPLLSPGGRAATTSGTSTPGVSERSAPEKARVVRPAIDSGRETVDAQLPPAQDRHREEEPVTASASTHPLDRPDELEPAVPAGPPLQKRSRQALGDVVAAFLNKHNIRWGELIAGLLIVVCSIGLVVSLWNTIQQTNRMIPALILVAGTAAIEGAGLYTLRRWRLRGTSRSVLVIASLLVPLNVVAAISLAAPEDVLLASPDFFSVAVMAVSAVAYGALMWLAGRELLGRDAWRWVVAILVPSITLLFVPLAAHLLESAAALILIVPVAAAVTSLTGPLLSFRRFATPGQLWRFLLHWAVAIFAIAVATAFTVSQTGLSRNLLAWLMVAAIPLFILAAADADRLRLHRAAAHRTSIGITGRAALLLCLIALFASFICAWPAPATALAWAAMMAAASAILIARRQMSLAKHAIFAAIAVAAICGVPQLIEPRPWLGWVTLEARLLTPLAVAIFGGLAAAFAATAAVLRERLATAADAADANALFAVSAARSPALLWTAGSAVLWTLLTSVVLLTSGPVLSQGWLIALLVMLVVQTVGLVVVSIWRSFAFHVAAVLIIIGWLAVERGETAWLEIMGGDVNAFASRLALQVLATIAMIAGALRLFVPARSHRRATAQWLVGLSGVLIALSVLWVPVALSWTALLILIAAVTLYGTGRADQIASLVELSFVAGLVSLLVLAQDRLWMDVTDRESWRSGLVVWTFSAIIGGYSLLWWLAGVGEELARRRWTFASVPDGLRVLSRNCWMLMPAGVAWLYIAAVPYATWIFSEGDWGAPSAVARPPLLLVLAAAGSLLSVMLAELSTVARPARRASGDGDKPAWLLPLSGLLLGGFTAAVMVVVPAWFVQLGAAAACLSVAVLAVACAGVLSAAGREGYPWTEQLSRITILAAMLVGGAELAFVGTAGVLEAFLAGRFAAMPFNAAVTLLASLLLLCVLAEAVHGWPRFRYATRGLAIAMVILLNFGYRVSVDGSLPAAAVLLDLIGSTVVGCWLVSVIEASIEAIRRSRVAPTEATVPGTGADVRLPLTPALPPALLGLPWHTSWNRCGSLATSVIALSILLSIAAAAFLFAALFANAGLVPYFSSPAVIAAIVAVVLTLWFVLERVTWLPPENETSERRDRWSWGLGAARHPWAAGSLVLAAGPLAMWAADGLGGLPEIGWWVWTLVMGGAAWIAALAVVLPEGFQPRQHLRGQERLAWILVGVLVGAATAGVAAGLSTPISLGLLASAVVLSFLLAYLRPDIRAAAVQAVMAVVVSVSATVLLWSELDLPSRLGFSAATFQLALLAACGIGVHALLWRARVLVVRPHEIAGGLRVDGIFAVGATGLGLVGVFAAANGPGVGVWFYGPLVGTAWLFAAVVTMIAASSLLRCEIPGQVGAGIVGLAAVIGSVTYEALEQFGRVDESVSLSAATLAAGLFGLLLSWELERLVSMRRMLPAPGDEALAGARRQANREATLVLGVGAGYVAMATFGNVLAAGNPASSWLWISALFAWAVAVAALAGAGEEPGLRTFSVVLLLAAVYAAALIDLPAATDAKLLAIAIRILVSSVALLPLIVLLVPQIFALSADWTAALLRGAMLVASLLAASAVMMLATEANIRSEAGIPLMPHAWVLIPAFALGAVAIAFLGVAILGRVPGVQQLHLSVKDRQNLVYAAQAIGLATWGHVYLCRPSWAVLGLQDAWPWICVAVAFAATGLSHLASRRNASVIAGPLRTNALIIPVVGIWMSAAEVQGVWPLKSLPQASLLTVITVHYVVLAALDSRRRLPQVLGIVAGNAAVWVWLASTPGWGFLHHPQLWIIPPAACALWAIHMDRDRLPAEAVATLRYSLTLIIYISSTADMLIQQVGSSLAGPMVLATLALGGMALGIALRIRPFLYLGAAFVFVALLSMVWHAQVAIDQVWPWWAFGISMGVALLVVLMLLERNRPAAKRLANRLRTWDG